MVKGDGPGVSPTHNCDPTLSTAITTGGLSAPASRWKARCHLLWIDGSWPPVHALLLGIDVEEPQVDIIAERQKIIFQLDSGACFSVLPFSPGLQSNDKVIIWGKSGQPLECYFTQPLACSLGDLLFCHSFLIVPETPVPPLGWDLLSQLKPKFFYPQASISAAPSFRNK
jgi:hypothetical protein